MIVVKWFFLILSVLSTVTAWAENLPSLISGTHSAGQLQNGKQALKNMVTAMQTLNYQGTVAFLRDGKLEPMRYSHAVNNGQEQEHLLSLNSPLREVVRETGKVSCLYKATHQLVVDQRPFERSFLVNMPTDLAQLDAAYDIEMQGEESVALLPANVVAIKPKDGLRYGRKIWLSQQWALPLKVEVYGLSGEIVEERLFTELQVKDNLPFIAMPPATNTPPAATNATAPQQAAFTFSSLPKGFTEVFFSRQPIHVAEQPVDHVLLSDGLASVSIYMEPRNNTPPPVNNSTEGVQTIDAINFFSHAQGNYQITVMGEVPPETIRLIADNVRLR